MLTLHDYLGLYDYFDFENGQPYTIIPYCTVIWDPRVVDYNWLTANFGFGIVINCADLIVKN